ncbi:TfoX/Sxy family protein [Breoghania sp. L-A4]|uniref:TfoX/Sxy family protein n=1 Tax=Breoghania sp. L-A4 TaxID=2304600 RepID=UPI000E3601D5|nr:TfoX/Sxy family protein [Breoghania sp. L-A4]AXS39425.1 TfoX family protein [Breoghania sp. L-A4]
MAAPSPQFRDHLFDLLAPLGALDTRRMFSGYSLRCRGTHFAMIMRERLYLVADETLRQRLIDEGGEIFSYEKQGKRVNVPRLVHVPDDMLDDGDTLLEYAQAALDVALRG